METYILIGVSALILVLVTIVLILVLRKNNSTQNDADFSLLKDSLKNEIAHLSNLQTELIRQTNNNIQNIANLIALNNKQLEDRFINLTNSNEQRLEKITNTVNENLKNIQSDNATKLEEMRKTVDEKLQTSLERRLNDSFGLVNQRLEAVYKGLGEMQSLASSVGDLRSVLSNVKIRGNWGENSLNNLLEQLLTSDQYVIQYSIPPKHKEKVDFAIKLPGKDNENLYLPIDVKFPIEDYSRLVEASENFDAIETEKLYKALIKTVKTQAKSIKEKYIVPPHTTDFAIMYLPIEGLYCEVVKKSGFIEELQRDYKVVVCGPTTISALLNSLQMGFKTLAIQKRSSEIWSLLSVFKKEFSSFCSLIEKTQKKLLEATSTIEDAHKKTATIQRKLDKVTLIQGENQQEPLIDIFDSNTSEIDSNTTEEE